MTETLMRHILVRTMGTRRTTSPALHGIHLLVAIFCLWNISFLPDRARVPFETVFRDGTTWISNITDDEHAGGLREGDRLVFWRVVRIGMPEHLELLADLSAIGDSVRIQVERDDELLFRTMELVPFYQSYRFAVVTAVSGLTILLFSLFVYFKRPGDPVALLLHWALLSLATVTMMTQGAIGQGDLLSEIRRAMLFLSYNATAACFFLFAAAFPRRLFPIPGFILWVVIGAFALQTGVLSSSHIDAMRTMDAEVFRSFQQLYDVFHFVFLLALVAGLALILSGALRERVPERRIALRWIVYGLVVGASPFLILVVLPQLWGPDLLAPEELATFFTLAIPLSFTTAFLRYHVFSIEIGQRPRLTTLLLRVSLSLLQVLFVAIILSIFWEDVVFGSHVLEVFAFGFCIILISPLRTRFAVLIEEAVFPARFNPTRLLQDASSRFHGLLVPAEVGPLLVNELHAVIPRFTFLWYRWNGTVLQPRATSDRSFLPKVRFSPHVIDDIHIGRTIVATGAVRLPDASSAPARDAWLHTYGLSIVIPLRSESDQLLGVLCAAKTESADPLDRGEYELVQTICLQATSVFEHLRLQESMILEQRKRRELEELSRLKSHFVSSVSHDLRTPLTSVGMFLELLEQPRLPAAQRNEYIGFIRQETQRLRRLVENVLDFAKAERGIREFSTERTDLNDILGRAAESMAGQFSAVGGTYTVRIPPGLPPIIADAHALERAFTNLLSNAFKYTPEKKRVSFTVSLIGSEVRVVISDNGFGIEPEELPKIFDPFYRVRDPATYPTGGVGLGLSLVKRTIDAHHGKISIASRPGKGTTITIELPVLSPPTQKG